jgi:coronin-1B/1C/6
MAERQYGVWDEVWRC